jgi:hypothetical protein
VILICLVLESKNNDEQHHACRTCDLSTVDTKVCARMALGVCRRYSLVLDDGCGAGRSAGISGLQKATQSPTTVIMGSRVIQLRNGQFRVLAGWSDALALPPLRPFTAEELWTARCELRREELATALRKAKCPEGARLIPLQGSNRVLLAIVDEEDFAALSRFTWRAWTRRGYKKARAVSMIDERMNQMDRVVMNVGHRYHHVRHTNGNSLDSRKQNLRVFDRLGTPRISRKTG